MSKKKVLAGNRIQHFSGELWPLSCPFLLSYYPQVDIVIGSFPFLSFPIEVSKCHNVNFPLAI